MKDKILMIPDLINLVMTYLKPCKLCNKLYVKNELIKIVVCGKKINSYCLKCVYVTY